MRSWSCTLVVKQFHDFVVSAETEEEALRLCRRYDYGNETLDHGNDEILEAYVDEIVEEE